MSDGVYIPLLAFLFSENGGVTIILHNGMGGFIVGWWWVVINFSSLSPSSPSHSPLYLPPFLPPSPLTRNPLEVAFGDTITFTCDPNIISNFVYVVRKVSTRGKLSQSPSPMD